VTSFYKSSIIRLLEELRERSSRRLRLTSRILLDFTGNAMRVGDKIFAGVSGVSKRLADALNSIQVRMIEPMIMAAIWSCAVMTAIVVAAILLR
jgi:hypothetical protein